MSNKSDPAVCATPFLGGVLHGSFENLIRQHILEVAAALNMTQTNQLKLYSVLPPPYGWKAEKIKNQYTLGCGIMLSGQAAQSLPAILPIIQYWQEIRLDGCCDRITEKEIHVCSPGNPPQLWDGYEVATIKPDFNYSFTTSDDVVLSFITPLVLESAKQKEKGATDSPPTLLRLTRSLAKRIQSLEPDLAEILQIGSTEWIEAEEKIRSIPIYQHHLTRVQWRYGSRTKICLCKPHG